MNIRHVATFVIAAALVGCGGATTSQTRPSDTGLTAEEMVARNAKARWDAILAKDFQTAYDYLTPGTRATTAYDAYARRLLGAAIRWTKAEVDRVDCEEPDVCTAKVYITYMVRAAQTGTGDLEGFNPVYEQWLRSEGRWYHLPSATGR